MIMKDLKKKNFTPFIVPVTLFLTIFFLACNITSPYFEEEDDDDETEVQASDNEETISEAESNNDGDHEESSDYTWSTSDVDVISLNGSSISESSDGAETSGSTLTIGSAGNYSLSGTLNDGQIIVNAGDDDLIRLILNGVDIASQNSAPIYIKSAEKVIVIVNDGTENTLTDGSSYNYDDAEDEEPNATLFSKTDLTVYGEGKLTLDANFNDAINCKDGLIIDINKLAISAVDDGIRGKDYLIIKDGTISIDAGGDGLKSDNDNDDTRGYIEILTADLDITASGDAISASTDILIEDGTFDLVTNGSNSSYSSSSTKGIKAGVNTIINAGTFDITCNEDAIHSDQTITINGGTYTISASDDGIHADYDLAIYDADVTISKSYEGIESTSGNMYIEGGTYVVNSSDDGLNLAAGGDRMGGGWGKSASSSSYTMYLNPDNLAIYAQGDGIDSNGSVEVSGGNIIVHGPTSSGNGSLDYDYSFEQNGGVLIAAGSSGMLQAPGSSSSQNSVAFIFRSSQSAGTVYHVESSTGNELFTFKSSKTFQAIVFSSPNLKKGTSYVLYSGGSASGTSFCGYYTDATYTGGTQKTTFTISSTVSSVSIN